MEPVQPNSTGTYLLLLLAFVLGFLAIWGDPTGSTASEEVSVGMLLERPSDYWGRSVRIVGLVHGVANGVYELTDRTGETLSLRTARLPREGSEVLVVAMVGQDPSDALRPLLIELDRDSLRRSLGSVLIAVALVLLASAAGIFLVVTTDRRLRRRMAVEPAAVDMTELPPSGVRVSVLQGPDQGKIFEFDQPAVLIGRPGERLNDLVLSDMTISRSQGRLMRQGGGVVYENESSTNPTRVNGQAVTKADLLGGDRLEMGETLLRIELIQRNEGAP